jgi:hypothetical protein
MRRAWIALVVLLAACAPRPPAVQTTLGGVPVDPGAITAADVARQVRITPRGDQVFFQAPPIQSTQIIDLSAAGKELGLTLGDVEQIRYGYLFGVLDLPSGRLQHYLLFQSNFIEGHDRYKAVTLADGTPLRFSVTRTPDPCIPNCFPVIEALIVDLPDPTLRALAPTGLRLLISIDTGQVIQIAGPGVYLDGYLQAVDGYPRVEQLDQRLGIAPAVAQEARAQRSGTVGRGAGIAQLLIRQRCQETVTDLSIVVAEVRHQRR